MRKVPRRKTDKVVFSAKVTEPEFEALSELAQRDSVTMTEIFRQWLRALPTYRQPVLRPPHKPK